MMYLKLIVCVILFIAFLLIIMNIIVSRIKKKTNKRTVWKKDKITERERDRVVTRIGGLAHDRIYEKKS